MHQFVSCDGEAVQIDALLADEAVSQRFKDNLVVWGKDAGIVLSHYPSFGYWERVRNREEVAGIYSLSWLQQRVFAKSAF